MFLRVVHLCSGFSFCSKEVERAKKETAARKRQEKRKREGAEQVGGFKVTIQCEAEDRDSESGEK